MREVLSDIGFKDDQGAVIYDAKQDILAYLSAIGLECTVVTLNPFDGPDLTPESESTHKVRVGPKEVTDGTEEAPR